MASLRFRETPCHGCRRMSHPAAKGDLGERRGPRDGCPRPPASRDPPAFLSLVWQEEPRHAGTLPGLRVRAREGSVLLSHRAVLVPATCRASSGSPVPATETPLFWDQPLAAARR